MTRSLRSVTAVLAPVVAMVVVLAGCSSNSDSASDTTGTPTQSTAASSDTDSVADTDAGAGGSSSTAAAVEGLIKPGELSVCIDPEYAPLEYYENGSAGDIIGADADSARALAKQLGLTLKFQVTSFDGLIPGLTSGRCDLQLGGLYMSPERLQVADAIKFMKAGPEMLMATDMADKVKTETDLCGLSIAAQSGSSNAIKIHQVSDDCTKAGKPEIKVTEYPQTADTVLAVINGKSQGLIETNVGAEHMQQQNEGKLVVVPGIFPLDTTFGAFLKKGNPLKDSIAAGLKALYDDGTLATIAEKYGLNKDIVNVY